MCFFYPREREREIDKEKRASYHPVMSRPRFRDSGLSGTGLLEDGLHHLVSELAGLGETRSEVFLDPLESIAVGFEITE